MLSSLKVLISHDSLVCRFPYIINMQHSKNHKILEKPSKREMNTSNYYWNYVFFRKITN